LTVTEKPAEPVLPDPSVAEQVTPVVPTGKFEPDEGEQDGVRLPETVSFADPDPKLTVVPLWLLVLTLTFAGGVTFGGVVSTTWTVSEPSVPQSTGEFPRGKSDPGGGEQLKPPLS
jgi:hypothetical protein